MIQKNKILVSVLNCFWNQESKISDAIRNFKSLNWLISLFLCLEENLPTVLQNSCNERFSLEKRRVSPKEPKIRGLSSIQPKCLEILVQGMAWLGGQLEKLQDKWSTVFLERFDHSNLQLQNVWIFRPEN